MEIEDMNRAKTREREIPQKVADAGAKSIKGYLKELRSQGKTKGKLILVVKNGKTKLVLPYHE